MPLSKRMLDLVFALAVIVGFGWGLVLIWLWIRATSTATPLFAQTRLGKDEKPFLCYKFRTMHPETKQAGTHEISPDAVTPIGHVLRKTKIDELPQVWNILRGEMSVVGPRPCLPAQVEVVAQRRVQGVFAMVPGITGLAQVQGIDMSTPERLAQTDAEYMRSRSFWGDVRLIILTALGQGCGDRIQQG
jgi:lipopolysaccharide/colanic/teichoic acid biosynthesis glycosyltransferase